MVIIVSKTYLFLLKKDKEIDVCFILIRLDIGTAKY